MKNVPAVRWPAHPAHVGAFGPLAGRNDHSEGMSPEAVLTPSAGLPDEEVTDSEGSIKYSGA